MSNGAQEDPRIIFVPTPIGNLADLTFRADSCDRLTGLDALDSGEVADQVGQGSLIHTTYKHTSYYLFASPVKN